MIPVFKLYQTRLFKYFHSVQHIPYYSTEMDSTKAPPL